MTERERKHERFSTAESERLYTIVRARTLAREVFSSDAAVAEWLGAPDRSLGGLVQYKRFDALELHVLNVVDVPDTAIERAPVLPHGWDRDEPVRAAQAIGDNWYDERKSPALVVPSAVTPGEKNRIINSRQQDWQWKWVLSRKPISFQ